MARNCIETEPAPTQGIACPKQALRRILSKVDLSSGSIIKHLFARLSIKAVVNRAAHLQEF